MVSRPGVLQMKYFWIIYLSLFLLQASTTFAGNRFESKYFDLDLLPFVREVVYSNKKVADYVIIRIYNGNGSIHILCIPFTQDEHRKSTENKIAREKLTSPREKMSLIISGREIDARKRVLEKNKCYISFEDYYEGVSISGLYSGDCNPNKYLNKILASIRYHISPKEAEKARSDFLYVMDEIKNKKIPVYPNSRKLKTRYNFIGLGRRVEYSLKSEENYKSVFEFYKKYFSKDGWTSLDLDFQGKWHDGKLVFQWIDKTYQIVARLFISSEKGVKNEAISKHSILLDLTPYIIMGWQR